MKIDNELKNLEKVQSRCIKFWLYLEKHHKNEYNDLQSKLTSVIGTLEDVLTLKKE